MVSVTEHNAQANAAAKRDPGAEALLKFFKYEHLPTHLQDASKKFHDLAHHVAGSTPPSAERTMALRKLLEAKDCAVRAAL